MIDNNIQDIAKEVRKNENANLKIQCGFQALFDFNMISTSSRSISIHKKSNNLQHKNSIGIQYRSEVSFYLNSMHN